MYICGNAWSPISDMCVCMLSGETYIPRKPNVRMLMRLLWETCMLHTPYLLQNLGLGRICYLAKHTYLTIPGHVYYVRCGSIGSHGFHVTAILVLVKRCWMLLACTERFLAQCIHRTTPMA